MPAKAACSFCREPPSDASTLLLGRHASICQRCVKRAADAVARRTGSTAPFTRGARGKTAECALCHEPSNQFATADGRALCAACIEFCLDVRKSESRIRTGKPAG